MPADPTRVVARRVVALIIDVILAVAVSTVLFLLLSKKGTGYIGHSSQIHVTINGESRYLTGGRYWADVGGGWLFGFLYFCVLQGRTGWTLGKLLLGIRLVRASDGSIPAGVGRALGRWLLWIVDDFPYIIPGLVGFVAALSGSRHQRIGDRAAGTLVIRSSAVGQSLAAPAVAAPAAGAPPAGAPTAGSPPANWYPDPQGVARLRYWDGTRWTDQTSA